MGMQRNKLAIAINYNFIIHLCSYGNLLTMYNPARTGLLLLLLLTPVLPAAHTMCAWTLTV
jgi:hypothetical protein